MKIYFKCEIKSPAGGSKSRLATELSHLNGWIIQERITETQNIAVAVWNYFLLAKCSKNRQYGV